MEKYKRIFVIVMDSLATAADNFGVKMPEGTLGIFLLEKLQ